MVPLGIVWMILLSWLQVVLKHPSLTNLQTLNASLRPPLPWLQVVLSSDEPVFGGYSNVTKDSDATFSTVEGDYDGRPNSLQVRSKAQDGVKRLREGSG